MDDDSDKIRNRFGATNTNHVQGSEFSQGRGKEVAEFSRDNPKLKGRWQGKEYKADSYGKKSWWGDKDYVKKVYGGNTDGSSFKRDSRFHGSQAREGSITARDSGQNYQTGAYATNSAREDGMGKIARNSDAETDVRRRVFTDPDIVPWQQQNGVTLDDSKRMLGR
jgi:hypothetical protein